MLRRACAASLPLLPTRSPVLARLLATQRNQLVKEMRVRTSAPIKKCVDALAATGDDLEAAIDWLRKAGIAGAAKKADRGAHEGAVSLVEADGAVALVEVNAETDFVARNSVFQELCHGIAQSALGLPSAQPGSISQAVDVAALGAAPLVGGEATSVTDAVGVAISQLGENIVVRRGTVLTLPTEGKGALAGYVHSPYSPGIGRTAAAVALLSEAADADALRRLGQRLAMHVVAAAPVALSREDVDPALVKRERDVLTEQALASGKKPEVVEKMVTGRLNKFYQEVALLEQPFVVDEAGASVRKALQAASKELGAEVTLAGFVRYHTGERS